MTKEEVNRRIRHINAQAIALGLMTWLPIVSLAIYARFSTYMDFLAGSLFVAVPCFFAMYMGAGVMRWYQLRELEKLSEEMEKRIREPKEV